jgi:thiamine biosynthesis protein ThiS
MAEGGGECPVALRKAHGAWRKALDGKPRVGTLCATRHALCVEVSMEIRLNGKAREVADGITISQLLDELKLQALRVAVQVNTDIVKRERFGGVVLQSGDTVEVLTFMSGG